VLPINGTVLLDQKYAHIHATPQTRMSANRLLVAKPHNWKILSLRIGPRIGGLEIRGDHPALLDPRPGTPSRLPLLSIDNADKEILLEVEYVGPRADSVDKVNFVACLCLEEDRQKPQDSRGPEGPTLFRVHAESPHTARDKKIHLALPPRAYDLHDTSLTLRVTNPEHWLVEDVSIDGDTLLINAGDLPGELFMNRPERVPLHLGRLRAKEELIIQGRYTGPLASAALSYEVSGYDLPVQTEAPISAFLTVSHGGLVKGSIQFTPHIGVPRGYAFLPEEIVLRDSNKWDVADVKNMSISQFSASGNAPGVVFAESAQGGQHLSLIPRGFDFNVIATYTGEEPSGEPFFCGIVGRVVRLPAPSASLDLEKIDQVSAIHGRLLAFLLGECLRNNDPRVVSVALLYASERGRDETIHTWHRAVEPALFSEFTVHLEFSNSLRERLSPAGAVAEKTLHPALRIHAHQRAISDLVAPHDVLASQDRKADPVANSTRRTRTPLPTSKEFRATERQNGDELRGTGIGGRHDDRSLATSLPLQRAA
jgi:hypothetical protein